MEVRWLNVEGTCFPNRLRPSSALKSPAEQRSRVILPGCFLMVGRRNLVNPWVHAHISRGAWFTSKPTSRGYASGCVQKRRSQRIGSDEKPRNLGMPAIVALNCHENLLASALPDLGSQNRSPAVSRRCARRSSYPSKSVGRLSRA